MIPSYTDCTVPRPSLSHMYFSKQQRGAHARALVRALSPVSGAHFRGTEKQPSSCN